jgi:hypothetical protein
MPVMNFRIIAIWFAVAALTLGVMGITSAVFEQVAHAQSKFDGGCGAVLENVPDNRGRRAAVGQVCGSDNG